MASTRPILVLDYVETPFEEVCELLADWEGQRVPTSGDRHTAVRVGRVDHIADHVARIAMFDDDDERIAELRVLAVSTGHDSLTEVLVFAHPGDATAAERDLALVRARSIVETALARLTRAFHVASGRAS